MQRTLIILFFIGLFVPLAATHAVDDFWEIPETQIDADIHCWIADEDYDGGIAIRFPRYDRGAHSPARLWLTSKESETPEVGLELSVESFEWRKIHGEVFNYTFQAQLNFGEDFGSAIYKGVGNLGISDETDSPKWLILAISSDDEALDDEDDIDGDGPDNSEDFLLICN